MKTYFDVLWADARDDITEEEWEPADDEHAHHGAEGFGSFRLLGESRHLLTRRRPIGRSRCGSDTIITAAAMDAKRDFAFAAAAQLFCSCRRWCSRQININY